MIYVCSICRVIRPKPFANLVACDECFAEFLNYTLPSPSLSLSVNSEYVSSFSLYQYKALIRDLVLNAKARCEWRAVETCQHLLLNYHGIDTYMRKVRGIIPAPSSLRSRLFGKYDLAFFLADSLSSRFGIPLYRLPLKYYWRFKKQSMIPREFREKHGKVSSFVKRSTLNQEGQSSLLIVDDVITTGSTVASIIKGKNLRRVKILTLASAYHRGPYDSDTT